MAFLGPWEWKYPFGRLALKDSLFEGNKHGFTAHLYSHPSDEYLTINSRHNWEKIRIFQSRFYRNSYASVYIPSHTKYNRLYLPTPDELQSTLRIAEVAFLLESCTFEENGGGIIAEHVGVGFSSNVWIWQARNSLILVEVTRSQQTML